MHHWPNWQYQFSTPADLQGQGHHNVKWYLLISVLTYTITSLSLIELLWIVRVQGAKIWFLHLVTWWPTYAPVTLVRSQRRSSKNSLGHKDRQLSGVWSQFVTNHTMYVQSFYADWRLKMVSTCFSPDFAKICDDLLHHSTFLYYGRGKNTLR